MSSSPENVDGATTIEEWTDKSGNKGADECDSSAEKFQMILPIKVTRSAPDEEFLPE